MPKGKPVSGADLHRDLASGDRAVHRAADGGFGEADKGRMELPHRGRRPVTDRRHLERVAVGLFADRGFERTTIDDIAAAAGIGRRTFFRYFDSKNDVVWGEFDEQLIRMRRAFASLPADVPVAEGLAQTVVAVNTYPQGDLPDLRRRMSVIAASPALHAHSAIRYDSWRRVVAEYVAGRVGQGPDELTPRLVAAVALASATAAYEQWLDDGGDLLDLLKEVLGRLASGFGDLGGRAVSGTVGTR